MSNHLVLCDKTGGVAKRWIWLSLFVILGILTLNQKTFAKCIAYPTNYVCSPGDILNACDTHFQGAPRFQSAADNPNCLPFNIKPDGHVLYFSMPKMETKKINNYYIPIPMGATVYTVSCLEGTWSQTGQYTYICQSN